MKNLLWLACEFDLDQSERKSTQVHASPGQTESLVDPSFQLAPTCDSVWPGLKDQSFARARCDNQCLKLWCMANRRYKNKEIICLISCKSQKHFNRSFCTITVNQLIDKLYFDDIASNSTKMWFEVLLWDHKSFVRFLFLPFQFSVNFFLVFVRFQKPLKLLPRCF